MDVGPYRGIDLLAEAVRDYLRCNLPLKENNTAHQGDAVDITQGPEPPEIAGEVFIAVHGMVLNNVGAKGNFSKFGVGFSVTVSMRTAHTLKPREALTRHERGLYAWVDRIVGLLDNNVSYVATAHEQLHGTESLNPGTKVIASPAESPRERTASWWGAKSESTGQIAGLSQTVRVSGIEYWRLT